MPVKRNLENNIALYSLVYYEAFSQRYIANLMTVAYFILFGSLL